MQRIDFSGIKGKETESFIKEVSTALILASDALSKQVAEFHVENVIGDYDTIMEFMETTQPSFSVQAKDEISIGRLNHSGTDYFEYMEDVIQGALTARIELKLAKWGGYAVADILDTLQFYSDAMGNCDAATKKVILKRAETEIKALLVLLKDIADKRIEYFRTTYRVSYNDFKDYIRWTGRKFYLDGSKIVEKTFVEFL